MNSSILKITIILFILVSTSCKTFTESSFYGNWYTKVNEPIDGKCKIEVEWKSDNTSDITFKYENGQVYKTSSKWKYSAPIYDEVFPSGIKGKAKIKWINKNKFELIIIENQDTENYKNKVRVFERKK